MIRSLLITLMVALPGSVLAEARAEAATLRGSRSAPFLSVNGDAQAEPPVQAERSREAAESKPPAASADDSPPPTPDTSLERWRTPVEALNERMIGTASRAVRFDWRNSTVQVGVLGTELLERNNFASTRLGLMARKPLGVFMGELAVTRAFTWETDSTRKLALTPYRQFGRPSRFELDVNVGYALAEGVVTAWPSFFPPAEMVFSANVGVRYLFYPGALGGQKFLDVTTALASPKLTDDELEYLEQSRPGGMQIDPARYSTLAGLSVDVYLQPGAFLTPRVMMALPLLTPANDTGLGFWWELSVAAGWAF